MLAVDRFGRCLLFLVGGAQILASHSCGTMTNGQNVELSMGYSSYPSFIFA
jgi:hypothetical protein